MAKWWEIDSAIRDAQSYVGFARQAIAECFPDDVEPTTYDAKMAQFLTALDEIQARLYTVITPDIQKQIDEEAEADDEMEARADAMSY